MFDLVLKNARLVTEDAVRDTTVGVTAGRIAEIAAPGAPLEGTRTLDCSGKLVLPGLIDLHVHFNEPGMTRREDYFTGSSAAAAGGVTLFADMPLTNAPYTLTASDVRDKIDRASRKSVVDFAIWAGFVEDNTAQMEPMAEAGAYGFKMFTCGAGDGFPKPRRNTMERGFAEARRLGAFIGVHGEDQAAMDRNAQGCPSGMEEIDRFLTIHSPDTELSAVRTVLELAERTGAHVHICHASLPESVDMVTEARKRGVTATVETCPQYLLCTDEDLRRIRGPLKCTPPVRNRDAVDGMWQRVFDGALDFLGTDHSPAETGEKTNASFDACWGGINGVQYLFSLLHTEGVVRRGMDIRQLVRLYSAQPARFIGHYPERGTLEPGSEASFVLFDPGAEWTIRADRQLTKHCQTPYDGMRCTGRIEQTWLRGEPVCIYDFDKKRFRLTGRAGAGELVTPVNNKGKAR
ncbi:allantoinase AllB [Pseudodesulfovibrio thermohalotolerans]|uniref:allantoinase AllB n=1 Tax=Pseudodesulfovibrio thermohalotolerans TaxID=2880651 RepID=UPI0024430BC2|nr:allantoinase AllB [Pseudodesulfovibrio thermohalotolerans]WFS63373.1 allantoinase AllB [Pseudodesulfovibrio thermohalotolerans]